jgi:hypothetical protein
MKLLLTQETEATLTGHKYTSLKKIRSTNIEIRNNFQNPNSKKGFLYFDNLYLFRPPAGEAGISDFGIRI